MIENLSITELESYIRLCDRKKEILYRAVSTNTADKKLRKEYERLFEVAELFDEEFDKRLNRILEDAEKG